MKPSIRRILLQNNELRDAGDVAFGILVLGILIAVGSLFAGLFLTSTLSARHEVPRAKSLVVTVGIWAIGMFFVMRKYRRATRSWKQERRGGNMLFLVETIAAILSIAASVVFTGTDDELVRAAKLYFAGFLLLLVFSHVAAYALLRYLPTLRETVRGRQLPAQLLLKLQELPNHLPDPTSPSVTRPAGAGRAPSVAADH
jgi:hypothetical protein